MKSFALLRQTAADPRLALMLGLGYSSGLPFLLIFSTQSAWLREAGVSKADIGLMSCCALAFSFKFLWAPFIDRFDPPGLGRRLGRRRAWMLIAQTRRRGGARRPRLRRAGAIAGVEHRLRLSHRLRRRDAGRDRSTAGASTPRRRSGRA